MSFRGNKERGMVEEIFGVTPDVRSRGESSQERVLL